MRTKFLILLTGFFLSAGVLHAQQVDCNTQLSLFSQSAKIKDYKTAKPHYDKLIQNCPDAHMAIYQYGKRMFKGLLKDADGAKKEEYTKGLIENYKKRLKYFPKKTKKGQTYADIAQVMYNNDIGTKKKQFEAFDKAWKEDKDSFNSPKALYTYFSLLVDLQDSGDKDLKDVFLKYDELIQKIENQEITRAEEAQPLIEKQEQNQELTKAEKRVLKNSEIYLTNFSKIKGGINQKLGERADCENLIPLYTKDFEENKNDVDWLKSAAKRLSAKECTEDPLFFKLVESLHKKEPSAKSALYLGQLAEEDGKASKALEYYNQSAELEDNNIDKARVYKMIASNYKSRGRYSTARKFYRKALKAQPSLGTAYLQIASMYAKSANNCGDNIFEKRAVYWLAADYARRAGRVNPSLKKSASQAANSYMGRAPQKADIFQYDYKPGSSIGIGCWIGESVTVPSL